MDKPLVLLHGEIKSPPFSEVARKVAGYLMRRLQVGESLSMPESRPMPSIGPRCHELRIKDSEMQIIWRVIYRTDPDAVLIVDVFAKKTQRTPPEVIWQSKLRLRKYDKETK
jgi:phage-related protein